MKSFFREFLSYSQNEKKAIIILIVLIILTITGRLILPKLAQKKSNFSNDFKKEIMHFAKTIEKNEIPSKTLRQDKFQRQNALKKKSLKLRNFSPNKITPGEWVNMGLPEHIGNTMNNYRLKGGYFTYKEDLLKIYGLDTSLYIQIESFITLPSINAKSIYREYQSAPTSCFPLEINTCDSSELTVLKGIGKTLAARIVKYRNKLGGYINKEQLMEVYGINPTLLTKIEPYICIDTLQIMVHDLNTISLKKLIKHPYITLYEAKAIIQYRELSGCFISLQDLLDNHLIKKDKYDIVSHYFKVD